MASRENIKGPIHRRCFVLKLSCPCEGVEIRKVNILYLFTENVIQVNEIKMKCPRQFWLGGGAGRYPGVIPPLSLESWRKRRLLMSRLDGYTPQVISTPADGCWASLPHHSCLAAALQPLLTAAEPKTNHSNLFWLNLTYQSQISLVSFCWVHPRWSLKIGIVWDQKC